jgi:hypothetical protein
MVNRWDTRRRIGRYRTWCQQTPCQRNMHQEVCFPNSEFCGVCSFRVLEDQNLCQGFHVRSPYVFTNTRMFCPKACVLQKLSTRISHIRAKCKNYCKHTTTTFPYNILVLFRSHTQSVYFPPSLISNTLY